METSRSKYFYGRILQYLRIEQDMKQDVLAYRLHKTQSVISKIERGKTVLLPEEFDQMLSALFLPGNSKPAFDYDPKISEKASRFFHQIAVNGMDRIIDQRSITQFKEEIPPFSQAFFSWKLIELFEQMIQQDPQAILLLEKLQDFTDCFSEEEKIFYFDMAGQLEGYFVSVHSGLARFNQALEIASNSLSDVFKGQILYHKSELLTLSGENEKALQCCSQAIHDLEKNCSFHTLFQARRLEAVILIQMEHYELASNLLERLKDISIQTDQKRETDSILRIQAWMDVFNHDYQKALEISARTDSAFVLETEHYVLKPYCFLMLKDFGNFQISARAARKEIPRHRKHQISLLFLDLLDLYASSNEEFESRCLSLIQQARQNHHWSIRLLCLQILKDYYHQNRMFEKLVRLYEQS